MTTPTVQQFDEPAFRQWYAKIAKRTGLNSNPDDPRQYYDYRAAFLAGATPDSTGHWPSRYKREGHPNLVVGGRDTRTGELVTPPIKPIDLPDADLYEHFRDKGLSHADAVLHVERRRRSQPPAAPTPQRPSVGQSLLRNAAQTATSGFADELVGQLMAAHGWDTADSATATVRRQREEAFSAHPVAGITGGFAGAAVNPLNYIFGPGGALTKGVGPVAKGVTAGAALGGAQGLGEADQDRLLGAAIGTAMGGVGGGAVGYVVGKVAKPLGQMWRNVRGAFRRTEAEVTRTLGKTAPPETVVTVTEAAHRAFLQKQGYPPHIVDQLIQTWKAGGKISPTATAPPVPVEPAPPVLRPGETVEQIAPKGFAVSGSRPTPPVPTEPTLLEMQGFSGLGKGQTLPYHTRGGRIEQAMAPPPVASPMPNYGPNQNAAFAEFLRGATPQDLASRVGTLRALGVPLPANAEAELLAYLTSVTR